MNPIGTQVDGHALKVWANRQMCERAKGGQVTRYDADFEGVAEAEKVSRHHYDAGDSYAWLWRNDSTTLAFTEEARAGASARTIVHTARAEITLSANCSPLRLPHAISLTRRCYTSTAADHLLAAQPGH